MLVKFEGELFVIGLGAVVGDSELYAELVAGDDLVGGIGDVQHLQSAAQRSRWHCIDSNGASGDRIATVIVPRPGERVVAGCRRHEAEGDIGGLAVVEVHQACRLEGTVNKHIEQSVGPLAVVGQVDVEVNGAAIVHHTLHGDIVNRVIGLGG